MRSQSILYIAPWQKYSIDEIFTENYLFTRLETSTVTVTRSIATRARSKLLTLTFDIGQLPGPRCGDYIPAFSARATSSIRPVCLRAPGPRNVCSHYERRSTEHHRRRGDIQRVPRAAIREDNCLFDLRDVQRSLRSVPVFDTSRYRWRPFCRVELDPFDHLFQGRIAQWQSVPSRIRHSMSSLRQQSKSLERFLPNCCGF